MAKKAPPVTITQFLFIVIPLFLLFPIVFYLGENGIEIGLGMIVLWGLFVFYQMYKHRNYKKPEDTLFKSSIERQNKIFIFGIIGIIIFMSMFFGIMYYWLKDVAVVENCKEIAFAKGQSVYTTGKVDILTYNKTFEECVKTYKVSFGDFYKDIFGAARDRAEEDKKIRR